MNVAIVIPVYKSIPSEHEIKSYMQCLDILKKYPIYIIAPSGLDMSFYISLNPDVKVIKFNKKYFKSINGYNKLLLSKHFYEKFISFTYILIHQLDAYVFRDELQKWCDTGYDYIGGFVHEIRIDNFRGKKNNLGLNGGLSLRKVKSCIKILNSFKYIYRLSDIINENLNDRKSKFKLSAILKSFYFYYLHANCYYLLNSYDRNEDVFWGYISEELFKWYRVAPPEEALKFSFDQYPEKSYELNNHKLPFGCHSFNKYTYFWNNFL